MFSLPFHMYFLIQKVKKKRWWGELKSIMYILNEVMQLNTKRKILSLSMFRLLND